MAHIPLPPDTVKLCIGLQAIASNETRTSQERRDALAQLLALKKDPSKVDAVPDSNITEIARLVTPWADREFLSWHPMTDGYTLQAAIQHLTEVRAFRGLLAKIVNPGLSDGERLRAIEDFKALYPERTHATHGLNKPASELFARVRQDHGGTVRSNGLPLRIEPPARPPVRLVDVWGWWIPSQFVAD